MNSPSLPLLQSESRTARVVTQRAPLSKKIKWNEIKNRQNSEDGAIHGMVRKDASHKIITNFRVYKVQVFVASLQHV